MLIVGFDCALENLGIVVVEFDNVWRDKIQDCIVRLYGLYAEVGTLSKAAFLQKARDLLQEIDTVLGNIVQIRWFNVIDLIPGNSVEEVDVLDRTKRLKALLTVLDVQFPEPDLVLIEYQMGPNDIARMVSAQLAYHYTTDIAINIQQKTSDLRKERKKNKALEVPANTITYAIAEYAIAENAIVGSADAAADTTADTKLELVHPTLKNNYYTAPDGSYENFIVKWSNSTANKKHTDYNFCYFLEKMGYDKGILVNIKNKTNDIADAFMMIFGYLKKNNMM